MQDNEQIDDAELAEEVGKCVKQLIELLEPPHREILTLVEIEGVDVAETAIRLGMPLTRARVLLHRARASLRTLLTLSCASCRHPACDGCACEGCAASGENNACH